MGKPIKLTHMNWAILFDKIKENHKPSVYLIRDNLRKTLGFTYRHHQRWEEQSTPAGEYWRPAYEVHLDFFDEKKKTMFLMKYGDYIPPWQE